LFLFDNIGDDSIKSSYDFPLGDVAALWQKADPFSPKSPWPTGDNCRLL